MTTEQRAGQPTLETADPRTAEVRALVAALDAYMLSLYPAESVHMVDVDDLVGPDRRFLLVRVDGEAVGCGGVIFKDGGYAEIKRVYAAPKARGLRIGAMIVSRLEAEAAAVGISVLRLETGIHQHEALAAFMRQGYERCGAFGDYPPEDPYSVFMEKRLPDAAQD